MTRHLMSPEELTRYGIVNPVPGAQYWYDPGDSHGDIERENQSLKTEILVLRKSLVDLERMRRNDALRDAYVSDCARWLMEEGRFSPFGTPCPGTVRHEAGEGAIAWAEQLHICRPIPGGKYGRLCWMTSLADPCDACGCQPPAYKDEIPKVEVELLWGFENTGDIKERTGLEAILKQGEQKDFIAGVDEALAAAEPVCSACGEKTNHVPNGMWCRGKS